MELNKKVILCVAIMLVVIFVILLLTGVLGGKNKSYTVGKMIQDEDITEFYYTVASSTNPPEYQRYRFFAEDGQYKFFHEQREGDHFPLTEEDATISGTIPLTDAQWQAFLDTVRGGNVVARSEDTTTGQRGPFLYLYWKKDRSKYQDFFFASLEQMQAFVLLCETLAK